MKELIEYLKQNKISFSGIDENYININDERYFLVVQNEEDKLFSEDFILMAESQDCNKYVYNFGGVWYWENKEDYEKPKLNQLKYIGQSTSEITTNNFLGVRGTYEVLNGSRLYSDWCKKAKFLKVQSLGICEKNTLAGTLKFQLECQKNKIKPILGATYTVFREKEDFRFDVKLYAKNEQGWDNLLLINKEVNVINNKFIKEERLIELLNHLYLVLGPKSIDFERIGELESYANFYQLDTVEYINNSRDEYYLTNLKKFVKSGLNPISITDAFYLDREDSQIKKSLNSISGVREYESDNQYFKDKEDYYNELESLFSIEDDTFFDIYSAALYNEQYLATECNFTINLSEKHLPKYIMAESEKQKYSDNEDMFWSLIEKGLENKVDKKELPRYIEQIEKEYEIINYGSLQDYFLINWEQSNWCKDNDIMTGLARGSAAGFQTSNILDITKIDPFDYDLIAERFLTKERAKHKIADIDCDVMQNRREEVKQHLINKYGFDQCCSVGTYGTFQIKGALKDLAKLKGIEFSEVNFVSSILENDCKEWSDIFKISSQKPRLKKFVQENSDIVNELFLILNAKKSTSIHASAFIITPSDKEVYQWMPVRKENKDGIDVLISEWEGVELEEAGFLKQDILGLLQLDKFHKIINLVKQNKGVDIDVYHIPLDDPKTFHYFGKGWNEDIFQFGTRGLVDFCISLKPQNINDLIAAVALYRPGAMENNFHNEYVLRKNGDREIEYYTGTEDITNNTYGLIVYQEQVMQICQKLGGFDLAQTDDIRKALGKKKAEILEPYKEKFIENSVKNGYDEEEIIELWDAIEKFSGYSFNLAHAAAYGITGYISQWLKVNYPDEFWTAAFEFSKDNQVTDYISEINKIGDIQIMSADINKSEDQVKTDFKTRTIYWPLISIKQCGDKAASQLIEIRDRDGQFFSFEEFLARNKFKGSKVTKQVIENLVMSGAFDIIEQIEYPSSRYRLIQQYRKLNKIKVDNEKDIFELNKDRLSEDWWWTLQQKKLSGIAFFNYQDILNRYIEHEVPAIPIEDFQLESYADLRKKVKIGGYITEVIERESKKGKWCRIILESNYTFISITIWAEQYKAFKNIDLKAKEKSLLLISGQIVYDSYKQENCLQTNDETEFLILD